MKNLEVEEDSNISESSADKSTDVNDDFSTVEIDKSLVDKAISKLVSDSCDTVQIIVNDDSSRVGISEPSTNKIGISEEISELISDTCDAVQVIVNNDSPNGEINKSLINERAISEEISNLVSDTCNLVQIMVDNKDADGYGIKNDNPLLNNTDIDSEDIFKTTDNDLYDAEMEGDDFDINNVTASDNNDSLTNKETQKSSEFAECDSGENSSNEEDVKNTNSFIETDVKDRACKERHWTERASLPYYREPKPDFFKYTRKLQAKLDPKPSVISSPRTIVLDEPFKSDYQESDVVQSSVTSGTYRNKTSTTIDTCLKNISEAPSKKLASGLIILDDYKSPRIKNSHFSRSSNVWNISNLQSPKEKTEPVPGSKYKALKEQLLEKIMLKKEASFIKHKEEQELYNENVEEEEEIVSDTTPYESENDLSDDDLDHDSPENADDIVLKDMLLKECENFSDKVSEETKNISSLNPETKTFNAAIDEDSMEEPMECYSLPSYQPGGGFSSSPLQKSGTKKIFSDSDFSDSTLVSSQQRSIGKIFSDSDFIQSTPSQASEPSQIQNLEFKDCSELGFQSSNEQEIIPHWKSLPVSEKQGSQLFDEDISVICSGKFPSTNEDIPWTPSSSVKNNHINKETDQSNESDDEELVRPAKKIKLSLVEKLWDSEDEDDLDSKDPILQNNEPNSNSHAIQSDSDDEADQDNEPDADLEQEDEEEDQSEIAQKVFHNSLAELDVNDADGEKSTKKFEINNFFENEAELSGEEGSSDENEDDIDEYDDEMITDEIVASEEKLRKEVGSIHFKRQQDEDDQIIRQLKNDFLPEGELYNENGQRKRRYIWSNIGMEDNDVDETKSDSEEEEIESLPTDYLKWQQEKNKSSLPEDDAEIVQTPKSIGLKVDIVGKVSVNFCSNISNTSISASPMFRRGSFLNSSMGKNVKFMKEFSNSEGSVSRKNFVFSSPQPTTSLPSTPVSEVKFTKINNSINNRSIFNKI